MGELISENEYVMLYHITLYQATLLKQYGKKPPKENLIQLSYAFPDLFSTLLKGGKIQEGTEETASPDPDVTSLDVHAAAPQEPGWEVSRKTTYSLITYIF